jgi:hypothetical protein
MTDTFDPAECDTDTINELLREEEAAVEAYTRAAREIADEEVIAELQKIRDAHSRAVRELRDQLSEYREAQFALLAPAPPLPAAGGNSGEPHANLSALAAAEEERIRVYERALANPALHPSCRALVRTKVLTPCQKHAEELRALASGPGAPAAS